MSYNINLMPPKGPERDRLKILATGLSIPVVTSTVSMGVQAIQTWMAIDAKQAQIKRSGVPTSAVGALYPSNRLTKEQKLYQQDYI